MKKKFVAALMLSMSLALTACGSSDSSSSTVETEETEDTAEEETDETSEEEETADAAVMTYTSYMDAEVDSEVTVEAYVQAKQSLSEDGTVTFYMQDEDGGYLVYEAECSDEDYERLEAGTKVRVTGYKSEWSGETGVTNATLEILDDEDSYVAAAVDVTSLLADDTLSDYLNRFVSFSGMTIEASTDADGNEVAFLYEADGSGEAGSDLYFNVSLDGETYTFMVASSLCDEDSEVYQAVTAFETGDVIDMEGFLYWSDGALPQITSVTVSEETISIESVEETTETEETE
ncbi:MAG: hypothetical protein LIO86_02250 [Lachnospiraceae bacterium]|nr:hypothetical protein [Lachnospiraceae bacterium]